MNMKVKNAVFDALKCCTFSLNVFFCVLVQALISIKMALRDPHGVLDTWDGDAVDPCSWTMVTCSPQNLVVGM